MTFNQLFNAVYGSDEAKGEATLAAQDDATRKAWATVRVLSHRKGFDWWWDDLDTKLQNEIFRELCKAIERTKT